MTLYSRSSSPPEITAEIASLSTPDTAAGKEEKILVLLYLTVAAFDFSHLKYHSLLLAVPHKGCLENETVLLNKIALRHWHNTCHLGKQDTKTDLAKQTVSIRLS